MAIAHVATEYVFSDFLLKDPNQARYRSVRTELAVDKIVTCVAVGLPLLLISLAFAQEVSVEMFQMFVHFLCRCFALASTTGTQISCFAPTNFSWRQAAYVDSFCWAVVHTQTLPMWLHKFFPYILLLVAVLTYTPALLWRFSAAPLLQSDLCFIMEELDRCYNRAVTQAKQMATAGQLAADSSPTESCYNYPVVKKFLETKRCSRKLLSYYLLCRVLTLLTLLCACVYLGCYLHLASPKDEFNCTLRVGLLKSDPGVPDMVQCKLIAVGIFYLLSLVNLIVFTALIPVVIYTSARPLFCYGYASFLEIYESLPAVSVLPKPGSQCDDLSLYLLLLEENISELKSYKYMKVLEMLKRRGESFDPMGLLQNLCPVKMDSVDGKNPAAAAKRDARAPEDGHERPAPFKESSTKMETEMKEIKPLLKDKIDAAGGRSSEGGAL